jgi:hypothetical protein
MSSGSCLNKSNCLRISGAIGIEIKNKKEMM